MRASAPVSWNILKSQIQVTPLLSGLGLMKSSGGSELVMPCPLPSHVGHDTNPSFSINQEKMVFNCFTCGTGGSLPTLVMEMLELDYPDAIKYMLQFAPGVRAEGGEEGDDFHAAMQSILVWDEVELEPYEFPVFHPRVLEPWQHYPIEAFTKRGIDANTQQAFGLGFDPEHYRPLKNGEEYVGRAIIIPHFFEGDLVGYQSGWLDEDRPKKVPKYTNTRNFPKAETLFNYDRAVESADSTIYVVESAITAIYLASLGYTAVGTFGAEVSDDQLELLMTFEKVATAFDNDGPGLKATRRVVDELNDTVYLSIVEPVKIDKGDLNDLAPAAVHLHLQDRVLPSYTWLSTGGR